MKTLYENARYAVVNDGCPGLKIYDKSKNQLDLYHFGAFYDDMEGYHPSALEAAKLAIEVKN